MLTTTPRRSPREGAVPTPTTSRPPPGVGLGDHRADLGGADVETDDELRCLARASSAGALRSEHDLVAEPADRPPSRTVTPSSGWRPGPARPPAGPGARPTPRRRGAPRRRRPCRAPVPRRRLMSISEISAGQRAAGAQQGADERDGRRGPAGRARVRMLSQLVLAEAADHRHRRRDRLALLAEQAAVLVEPVQPPGVHEREGPALLDHDRRPGSGSSRTTSARRISGSASRRARDHGRDRCARGSCRGWMPAASRIRSRRHARGAARPRPPRTAKRGVVRSQ